MAVTEVNGLLFGKDADGNLQLIYPGTRAGNVDGLSALLAEKADRATLLSLNTTTQYSTMDGYTASGMYWINPGVVQDAPGGQWGFLRVFSAGNILQEFTGYSDNARAVRMFVNSAWTAWSREQHGAGNGWSYTIHPDGSCELWKSLSVSGVSCTTSLGSLFRTAKTDQQTYPFTVQDANVQASWKSNGYGAFLWPLTAGDTSHPPQYYLVRASSSASMSGTLDYYVRGKIG